MHVHVDRAHVGALGNDGDELVNASWRVVLNASLRCELDDDDSGRR